LGIVTSDGIIHDFAGPYFVNVSMNDSNSIKFFVVEAKEELDIW